MKIKSFLIYIMIASLLGSCAEIQKERADKNFKSFSYDKAISLYKKSLAKRELPGARVNLADALRLTNRTQEAELAYKEVLSSNESRKIDKFYYAKMLMANQKYDEASKYFRDYLRDVPGDIVAQMLLASCNSVSSFKIDTTLYTLNEVKLPEMNSSFSAVKYNKGIVFTGDVETKTNKNPWTGASYLDLYYTQKDTTGKWLSPELLNGDINGKFHEGPAAFNSKGDIMYFTRSSYKNKRKLEVNNLAVSNLKIYQATLVDGKWTNLQELPFNSDNYSVGHPALAADDKTLYFISDMPGGFGGTDIYVSHLENGAWSAPQNLGPVINTPGNEMFPYIHKDGTLYFSSEGHNSMGGLDVFMSYFDGAAWHEPLNLNYPLNSSGDDFAYVLSDNGRSGYVSSNRHSNDKVYQFEKHDPTLTLQGLVTVKGKGTVIEGAKVTLYNLTTKTKEETFTDKNGHYFIALKVESDYKVLASKENYMSKSETLSTMGQKISKDYYQDFQLEEIVLQKPIVLENIYYDFDKWNIRPDAARELDKFVIVLKDNPRIRIEMGSHTDCRGTYKYNEVLSDRRAMAAVQYLVSRGIEASRMTWKGYGETVPVNNCTCEPNNKGPGASCSEEEHQKNRRTEFKVIEVKKQALNE